MTTSVMEDTTMRQVVGGARRRVRLLGRFRRAAIFAGVGGVVALLGLVLLYGLVDLAHIQKYVAYLVQAIVSIELSFVLNGRYTWRDRAVVPGLTGLAHRWMAFHTAKVFTILLNQLLFAAFLLIHTPYLAAYLGCIAVCTAINYRANDTYVFRTAPIQAHGRA